MVIGSLMAASEVPLTHWAWWVFVMPGSLDSLPLSPWGFGFSLTEEGRRS